MTVRVSSAIRVFTAVRRSSWSGVVAAPAHGGLVGVVEPAALVQDLHDRALKLGRHLGYPLPPTPETARE